MANQPSPGSRWVNDLPPRMIRKTLTATLVLALAPVEVTAGDVHYGRLPNGATYVLEEDRSTAIVAVSGCFLETGSLEAREDSGLSHFFEHLVIRGGTKRQEESEWRRQFGRFAVLKADTGPDATCFHFRTRRPHLEEALDRYFDAVFNLEITEAKVERERGVVFQEFDRGRDHPLGKAWAPMLAAAFERHPYGTMTIGKEANLRTASADSLRRMQEEVFTADRFVLAAVGDFEAGELVPLLSRTLGTYPAGVPNTWEKRIEPPQTGYREVSAASNVSQVYVVAGFKIPPAYQTEAVVLEILATLLADGSISRLHNALVASGLAEAVRANANLGRDPGLLVIELEIASLEVEATLDGFWGALLRFAADGPTQDEVERARQRLVSAYLSQQDSVVRRSRNLARAEIESSALLVSSYPARLAAVTPEAVKAAAVRFLSPDRCTLSAVHPADQPFEGQAAAERVRSVWPSDEKTGVGGTKAARDVLSNGIAVVSQTREGSGTQALHLAFHGEAGASTLAGKVIPRLVEPSSGVPLRESIEALGGSLIAKSHWSLLELSLSVPLERFGEAVDLLASALSRGTVDSAQVREIGRELAGQLAARKDNPLHLARDQLLEALFPSMAEAPLAVPTGGAQGVRQLLLRTVSADGAVAASVGGLAKASLLEKLESSLGLLRARQPAEMPPREDRARAGVRERAVEREQLQVVTVLGAPAVGAADPDYWPLQLAVRTLFSRLSERFVRQEGVAYQMVARLEPGLELRPVTITFGVAPDDYERVYAGVRAELESLIAEPLGTEELDSVRDRLVLRHALALDTNSDRAERYATWELVGLGYSTVDRLREILSPIEAAEVNAVAKRYLHPSRFLSSRVGSLPSPP